MNTWLNLLVNYLANNRPTNSQEEILRVLERLVATRYNDECEGVEAEKINPTFEKLNNMSQQLKRMLSRIDHFHARSASMEFYEAQGI